MKKVQLPLFVLLVSTLLSCKQTNKSDDISSIEFWINKELLLPDYSNKFVYNNNLEYLRSKGPGFKIVKYMDGNCPKCFNRLGEWKAIIEKFKDYNVHFYFYIYSNDIELVKRCLNRETFTYPVNVDSRNELYTLNVGLEYLNYSTFLLDRNNNILLVGSPLLSVEMQKLYVYALSGKSMF